MDKRETKVLFSKAGNKSYITYAMAEKNGYSSRKQRNRNVF